MRCFRRIVEAKIREGIRKARPFLVGLFLIAQLAVSQSVPAGAIAPTEQVPLVNPVTEMKKTVVFLRMNCSDGVRSYISEGTGFFVSVPSSDQKLFMGYLVTNRHVAFPKKDGKALQVAQTFVRLSRRSGEAAELPLTPSPKWIVSADQSVDLAVFPLIPSSTIFDYRMIPFQMLLDEVHMRENGVAEAQPILFVGFFKQYPGVTHLEPIVRQGVIAMLPNERIAGEDPTGSNLFLADTHAFHGNSGSPVFTDLGGFRNGSLIMSSQYAVIGVINGFFSEESPLKAVESSTLDTVAESNSGVATIVPSDELIRLLNSSSVKADRETGFRSLQH